MPNLESKVKTLYSIKTQIEAEKNPRFPSELLKKVNTLLDSCSSATKFEAAQQRVSASAQHTQVNRNYLPFEKALLHESLGTLPSQWEAE